MSPREEAPKKQIKIDTKKDSLYVVAIKNEMNKGFSLEQAVKSFKEEVTKGYQIEDALENEKYINDAIEAIRKELGQN